MREIPLDNRGTCTQNSISNMSVFSLCFRDLTIVIILLCTDILVRLTLLIEKAASMPLEYVIKAAILVPVCAQLHCGVSGKWFHEIAKPPVGLTARCKPCGRPPEIC